MKLNDTELYEAISREGPNRDKAISQLREALVRGLSKALAGRYGKPVSAEDVAQEALVKILRTLDRFEQKSKFITWSMTIAIRIGISDLRRKHHADQSIELFQSNDGGRFEIAGDNYANSPELHCKTELLQTLQNLVETDLTEKQRIVIRAYLSDYSTDGIAKAMGMNRNAVYKLFHDARQKLKSGIQAAGYDTDDVLALITNEV